jgi:hypothetical protein
VLKPRIPFTYQVDFHTRPLLPGDAWNYLLLVCLIFIVATHKKTTKKHFTLYLFIIIWAIGNYARADFIAFMLLLSFRFINWEKISRFKKVIILVSISIYFLVNIFIGMIRGNNIEGNVFQNFFNQLPETIIAAVNQATAADIIHIFNTGFYYTENYGYLFG